VSYPVYPTYRPARHFWLDQIPTHWDSVSLRLIAKRSSGGTPDKANSLFWTDGTIPWLNSGEVNQGVITEPTTYITEDALSQSSAKWVPPNAIIVALAGQGKTKGMAAITTFKTTCNQSMAAVVFEIDHPKFMYWWLVSQYKNIRGMASDDARDGLNLEMIATIPCPRPSVLEQQKIAAFLDSKTGQIDALIAKKKELLGKLKEKRLAVITQAVTKGLDPAVLMRDSGIPWLGDVPKHWEVLPIKHLLTAILDTEHKTCPYYDDGEFLVARTPNIRDGKLTLDGAKYTDAAGYQEWTARGIPKPGDILFTREAPAGEACIVPDEPQLCIGQRVVLFRTDPQILESRYAIYSIYGGAARNFIEMHSLGSTVTHFNMSEIAMIPMLAPPIDEQTSIAEYLDKQTSKIDQMMSKVESAIARLTEYRTALITAATTGKIDVRNWQNPARKGKGVSLSLAPS
jgi:type I restriction enzyme S subunit